MSFDPIRQEELRIMGYSEVVTTEGERQLMAKEIAHDGPVTTSEGQDQAQAGDYLVEDSAGYIEVVDAEKFQELGWVLTPVEPTAVDGPVELAQPAGLLQVETEESPADA